MELTHGPVMALVFGLRQWFNRMFRVFERRNTARAPPFMSDHYIEFQDVTKAFDGHVVLDRVSFFVDPGETCVIMGRSGVGKSFTLKHIMGFLKPDSGRVFVAGEDITDMPEDRL